MSDDDEQNEPAKAQHGGARPGSGRKVLHGEPMSEVIYVRATRAQKLTLEAKVERDNIQHREHGRTSVGLARWLLNLGLRYDPDEH